MKQRVMQEEEMLFRKVPTEPRDDVDEARALREEADTGLIALQRQAPYVARLTDSLIKRRELNHFGELIQVTFTPRGTNA